MTESLRAKPPQWLEEEGETLECLPDAATDKRELWELVATCTPGACISAHYSSLTLRVVADWLERQVQQADVNGWDLEPWQLVQSLRHAALAADTAIESGDCLPRTVREMLLTNSKSSPN